MKLPSAKIEWREREYDLIEPISATRLVLNGTTELTQVCSTQYLGMLWRKEFESAVDQCTRNSKAAEFGSVGSNFLGGSHIARIDFEKQVATTCNYEDAVAFATGWSANFAVAEVLSSRYELVFSDIRNHNSMLRGLNQGGAKIEKADLASEEATDRMSKASHRITAVVAPSIHGLTGESIAFAFHGIQRESFLFVLDECHSFGAIGDQGIEIQSSFEPDVRILGFSKAIGCVGAVVCCPKWFGNLLRQLASPFMFSTATPPFMWRLNAAALALAMKMKHERKSIRELAESFRRIAGHRGLRVSGDFHISSIHFDPEFDGKAFELSLINQGFYLKVSEYPSRPKGKACSRVAFNPFHTDEEVRLLVHAIAEALK